MVVPGDGGVKAASRVVNRFAAPAIEATHRNAGRIVVVCIMVMISCIKLPLFQRAQSQDSLGWIVDLVFESSPPPGDRGPAKDRATSRKLCSCDRRVFHKSQ